MTGVPACSRSRHCGLFGVWAVSLWGRRFTNLGWDTHRCSLWDWRGGWNVSSCVMLELIIIDCIHWHQRLGLFQSRQIRNCLVPFWCDCNLLCSSSSPSRTLMPLWMNNVSHSGVSLLVVRLWVVCEVIIKCNMILWPPVLMACLGLCPKKIACLYLGCFFGILCPCCRDGSSTKTWATKCMKI